MESSKLSSPEPSSALLGHRWCSAGTGDTAVTRFCCPFRVNPFLLANKGSSPSSKTIVLLIYCIPVAYQNDFSDCPGVWAENDSAHRYLKSLMM